jgi:WD40 repeat protein
MPDSTQDPQATVTYHPPAAAARAPAPSFPGYESLEVLGRGGMGVVYRARDTRLGRVVALKVLRAGDQAGEEDLARFRAEAEAVARMQHPHIVQIFEVGEHEGRAFCALEYVGGGSLARRLGGTPLPARDAAALVETLAGAVQYAHDRRVLHRDLKPANVLLTEDGTPKVADFGLAKRLDVEDGRTRTGAVMGTPAYMAPEQAAGDARALGPAADVYALGAILYECLTGRPPFLAETPLATLEQVRAREPVPVRALNPKVPRDLETVCLKCLRKEPARRYPSARELADDLRRFQGGEPVRARPVPSWERALTWARRRPAAVLAAVAVVLAAGGGLAWWQYAIAEAGRQEQSRLRGQVEEARDQAEAANEKLDQVLYLQRVQGALREWQASDVARARALLAECPAGRRGWEWHYVRRLLHPLHEVTGVTEGVDDLQYTPDGKRLITSGRPGALRAWDPVEGRELFYLEGTQPQASPLGGFGTANANPVRFLIDPGRGEILAQPGGGSGPLQVWDLATGQRRRQIAAGRVPVKTCLARDPGGTWLAFGCGGSNVFAPQVFVMDAATGKDLATLRGHPTSVVRLAANADGTLLASGCEAGYVKVWDSKTWKEKWSFRISERWVAGLAFRPGTTRLLAVGQGGQLRCWDVADGGERYRVDARPRELTALAVRPDGQRLACGTDTGEVQTYEAEKGERQEVYRGHLGPRRQVTALGYSPDGTRLVSAGMDGALRVWDATRGQEAVRCRIPVPAGASLALDPRTGALVGGGQDGVRRWEQATGRPAGQQRGPIGLVVLLAVAAGADRVALASADGTVRVWDWRAERQVLELVHVADRVQALDLSPDGRALVLSGWGGQGPWLRCWEVETGRETPWPQASRPVLQVKFAPGGRALALADDDGELVVRRFPGGEEWFRYRGSTVASAVAFSADGALLAAGVGPRVRVWAVGGWQEVLNGWGRSAVGQLAFHPDGKRLAASGEEVTLWDLTTAQQALTLPGSTPQVALAFTADGRALIGATLDGALTIWQGPDPASP